MAAVYSHAWRSPTAPQALGEWECTPHRGLWLQSSTDSAAAKLSLASGNGSVKFISSLLFPESVVLQLKQIHLQIVAGHETSAMLS